MFTKQQAEQWEALLAIGECGSMAGAARALGLERDQVVRYIESLQLRLAVRLVQGSCFGSGPVTLTDSGRALVERLQLATAKLGFELAC
jgi:molybdate transport repressor ModE-like protein